ncbi:DUF2163 domain-containing protein [Frigidibacter sp.]|uniref:DUF2163 domain-containing protein n=1 Tax=Frigidibacter sp. TaxID=2586418 RepID=UPI00273674AC|nr:DUF2163 domain-containing protein [Frigidibacter sp.]MDP3339668.1 DUF2163 domain-containing protein [Frigidibacter sp.]
MSAEGLFAHLASGASTVCRCWAVVRKDGTVLGFTDHDRDLSFEGIVFRADSGITARALAQTTGLSVDNSEAYGALRSDAIAEADILAGRFDGADVRAWLVNWAEPEARLLQFRGSLGELTRAGGAFTTELRGLSEPLNHTQGRIFLAGCTAVLGDARCKFDLSQPGYSVEVAAGEVTSTALFRLPALPEFEDRWFEKGRLSVLSGAAAGLWGSVKNDRVDAEGRSVELWQGLRETVAPGDQLRLEAGCDKRGETCRLKFQNFANFRGFPHIPGEDWLTVSPVKAAQP